MPKRSRSVPLEVVSSALGRAKAIKEGLKHVYGRMEEGMLWNTSIIQTLVQPTLYHAEASMEYRYIGRAKAKDLLLVLRGLASGGTLQIQGAKGSGKSTVVSSLAGYMLGKLGMEVVYICASRFIEVNTDVLQHALLVASGDEALASFTKMEDLCNWCKGRMNPLLFVVDEWDRFENHPADEKALMAAVTCHNLVRLSSINSLDHCNFIATDKPLPSFAFDGPYTQEELETWIAQSSLSEAKLKSLDWLTGGMPRLLRLYEESGGNGRLFRHKIHEPYTVKLLRRLIGLQTTKQQLASAVQTVTMGVPGKHLVGPVDMSCFYREGNRVQLLSPYLRSRAEYYLMEQQSGLDEAAIRTWVSAVRMDCIRRGRNPAQAGWNVEGLVIAVMKYQKKLWNGLPFELCKAYEPGGQAALLKLLTADDLRDGVLVVPVAFHEKAVDVVYLKLDKDTGILTVKAVQITISKWKNKRRKGSHKVWQEQVLPSWLAEGWAVDHQFIYLMPQKLKREDLETVNDELASYIAGLQNQDAAAEEGEHPGMQQTTDRAMTDDEDEDEEREDTASCKEYETVDFAAVTSQSVAFKRLQDVHRCLRDIDRDLDLKDEPPELKKGVSRQCVGRVGPRQCSSWCRTDAPVYFCCDAHVPA